MIVSNIVTRSLLVATLALSATSPFALDAMIPEGVEKSIPNDHIDDIVRNCEDTSKLFDAIKLVCESDKPDLAVEIIGQALKRAGLSACELTPVSYVQLGESFKNMCLREKVCVRLLDEALYCENLEVLAAFLAAADSINKGWARKLIYFASVAMSALVWRHAYFGNKEIKQIIDLYYRCND